MNSTKVAVSNSGPLFHLAKAGLLDLMFNLFEKIIIPEVVFNEVVIRGKEENHPDAIIIEQAIKEQKIEVNAEYLPINEYSTSNLHEGELQAIKLAITSNIEDILLDDDEARSFARTLHLKVKGTLGILLDLVQNKLIPLNEAFNYLKMLNSIMYLSSDVYDLVAEELNKYYK